MRTEVSQTTASRTTDIPSVSTPIAPSLNETKSIPKLYVYDGCPFCVRTRTILGIKKIDFELIFLMYADEKIPMELVGAKQTPIFDPIDAKPFAESMDIIEYVDKNYGSERILKNMKPREDIMNWIKAGFSFIRVLLYPRLFVARLPETAQKKSREYFQKKKEKEIALSFEDALAKSPELLPKANAFLEQLVPMLHSSESVNEEFGIDDLIVFSMLHNLTIAKGLNWPPTVRKYVDYMSKLSDVPLMDAIAS